MCSLHSDRGLVAIAALPLSRLLATLSDATVVGSDALQIGDLCYDSRQAGPGSLFVAVPSVGGDASSGGARFIPEAIRRGAIAVLVQGDREIDGVTAIHVPDARAALADLATEFFGHPSTQLSLYAVTGTDGKTTTSYLLEGILSYAGRATGLIGTVETKIGERRSRNADRMTTPESLDLQRLLREMVDAGVTHAVMEASSHALALQRLRGSSFAACAVTNITADHIEFHGSWDAYFDAKASLFTDLARGRPAVLNRDDQHFERLRRRLSGAITTYSVQDEADVWAEDIEPLGAGMGFVLYGHGVCADVHLPLAGRYNVSNALAAAGLALTAGLSLETVAAGLSAATPPPGRMQHVCAGQPFDVLVDYAHTVNAFRSVLSAVRERARGRVIAVFGAAGDRDRAKRPQFARIANDYVDLAIVTNEDPFGEQPEAIIDEVLSGVPADALGTRFVREPDRGRAIVRAVGEARPGDTVVILGKGHEQNIVVNGQKVPWSDVTAAREAIERRG